MQVVPYRSRLTCTLVSGPIRFLFYPALHGKAAALASNFAFVMSLCAAGISLFSLGTRAMCRFNRENSSVM